MGRKIFDDCKMPPRKSLSADSLQANPDSARLLANLVPIAEIQKMIVPLIEKNHLTYSKLFSSIEK